MKFKKSLPIAVLILAYSAFAELQAASYNIDELKNLKATNSPNYSSIADAVLESIQFPSMQSLRRAKLPGSMSFFLETGGRIFDIDDSLVAAVTSNSEAPDSYKSMFVRGGTGLPYGIYLDTGVSYNLNHINFASSFTNLGFQALDFANMVYTDMIPSASLNVGFNYAFNGPGMYAIHMQALLGAYHRYLWAQVSYIFQTSYAELTDVSHHKWFIRHGLSSYWPLFEGLFIQQDVFINPIEASVAMGYQF